MKRLYLLRHAKAAPGEAEDDDFSRTLALSGIQDGARMARWLRENGHVPDLILASAAARAAQTAELMLQQIKTDIEYRDTLYLAEAAKIVAAARGAPAAAASLMIVGHNPGLEDAASLLADAPLRRTEQGRPGRLGEKFPTCALAILDFDIGRWRDLREGGGRWVEFVRPMDV
jgi:phosphohistidine phosphatase